MADDRIDFDDKEVLKTQIQFFIGQPSARKIEITKDGAIYKTVFTADDPPPPPAGVS
jgi:hypothetical protein